MDPDVFWNDKMSAARVLQIEDLKYSTHAEQMGEIVLALLKAAKHNDTRVRLEAVRALGQFAQIPDHVRERVPEINKVIPALQIIALRDPNLGIEAKKILKRAGVPLGERPATSQLPLFDPGSPSRRNPSEFVIKQKFQKSDYDCGQTVLDMLGYDGHALVPNRALTSPDLWAIDGIKAIEIPLGRNDRDPEALDYTRPHIWLYYSKPLLERAEKWIEERRADWGQKHREEVIKRMEGLSEEELKALDKIALFEEVAKDMPPRPTPEDAMNSVGAGHFVIRHKDKIYCPHLGTVDAETYTKEAIGLVTQVFSVIPRESSKPGTVKRRTPKVKRNDPCPCGSKRKFKKCCGKRRRRNRRNRRNPQGDCYDAAVDYMRDNYLRDPDCGLILVPRRGDWTGADQRYKIRSRLCS